MSHVSRHMSLSSRESLLPKNNARLRQIVGRQLHLHFVARDDPDEMLPHLARNVGEDVAFPWQFDPEHRSRQDLGDGSFGQDLVLFRHERIITNGPSILNSLIAQLNRAITRLPTKERHTWRRPRRVN